MNLIATMACRNEAHEIGLTLRVALRWNDAVVVLLHACTDASPDIVNDVRRENPGRVFVLEESGDWLEMQHRERMLNAARAAGATHIGIVDADELVGATTLPLMRGWIERMPRHCIFQLALYNLRGGIERYHHNGIWGNRITSVAFADNPALLSWSGDKFHSREPGGRRLVPYRPVAQFTGGVLHLWGSSLDRLRAKHRLYRVVERIRWPNKPVHEIERMYAWSEYGEPGHPTFGTPKTWTYADVPDKWWEPYSSLMKYLDLAAKPWQDAEADRLIAQYGREYFRGLRI